MVNHIRLKARAARWLHTAVGGCADYLNIRIGWQNFDTRRRKNPGQPTP
jgi:hypothetical protein